MKELEFDREYRIGNFVVEKLRQHLDDEKMAVIREELGIGDDLKVYLDGEDPYLPVICVSDIAGAWGVSYAFGYQMYQFFDSLETGEDGEITKESVAAANVVLQSVFFHSTFLGDVQYYRDAVKLCNDTIERAGKENLDREEEDDEALEKARATIIDLKGEI